MNDQIVTNMAEVSKAAEEKFKDMVNGNTPETPTSLQEVNKTDTTMPEMGHNQPDVVIKNEFKTGDGVLGEDPTLVTPPYENPTPDTEQEKAPAGVTDETAAVVFDANVTNADAQDHEENLEEAYLKAEEELNKAFEESTEGEPYTPEDSSMDGSSDTPSTPETNDVPEDNGDAPVEEDTNNDAPVEEETSEEKEEAPEEEAESEEEKKDEEDEANLGNECDETGTDYVNVSVANPSSVIEEKVDGFITTDGDKVQDLIPPVIEVDLTQDELPAENPVKEIVKEENVDTGSVGAAPGAEEIIAELNELNIVADSIGDGSTENIGDSGSGEGEGEKQIQNGENLPEGDGGLPGTESEEEEVDEVPTEEDTKEPVEETEEAGTDEVPNDVAEGGETPDTLPKDPQPVDDAQRDVSADAGSSEEGAQVGEAGDTNPLDTDVDLHGSEFEKAADEFDNIIKTDEIGEGSTVGETYTQNTDLVTGGLQEMAAHAESVRAELRKMGAQVGFETVMMGIGTAGMESATNTADTFDNSGDLFKDIFKGL